MAQALRKRGQPMEDIQRNLSRIQDRALIAEGLREMAPVGRPSAEYVARANMASGQSPDYSSVIQGMDSTWGVKPQLPFFRRKPTSAQALGSTQASGAVVADPLAPQGVDPRMLAAMLRAGR